MTKNLTAPVIITIIVLVGFTSLSIMAMKPQAAGVEKDVVLYLLGAWQSLASAAVMYWVGSSAGSKGKDDVIRAMTGGAPAADEVKQ